MTLNDRLKDVVGAKALVPEAQLSQYTVGGVTPKAVVIPSNVDALRQVVSFAAREGFSITPWGGGTQMSLGNLPSKVDIVLKTTAINRVAEHSESDFTMAVGAGASLSWVQNYLASKGQHVPLDAPLPGQATVGGVLAAATTTPRRLLYNLPRDWVLGMKVVQPDGSLTSFGGRVVKNVSGYDVGKLYIGSFGTLGVIVEATLRLVPATRSEVSFIATYPSIQDALKAARSVLGQRFIPQCTEVVSGAAMKVLPSDLGKNGGAALLVSAAGWPSATKRIAAEMGKLLGDAESLETLSAEAGARMWRSLTDLGWQKDGAPLASLRASVLPSRVESLLEALGALLVDGLETGTVIGPGYGGIRFLVWAGQSGTDDVDRVRGLVASLREQVARLEGRVIVESCSPKIKAGLDVWGKVPGGLEVMRRLKREIDPKGIFNPGRFVEGI